MVTKLSQGQISYLDLAPIGHEFTPAQYRASAFDAHPSAAVHHRIALRLADDLEAREPRLKQP